jgi:hypothetical protein
MFDHFSQVHEAGTVLDLICDTNFPPVLLDPRSLRLALHKLWLNCMKHLMPLDL